MLRHVAKHSKQRKTTKQIKIQWIASIWCQNGQKSQNYKTDQNTMNCIDLMSKRSKIAKLQKESNYDQFASIWRQNDQKCWVTLQNIRNNAKLQNWSNYNELHRFDVKTIKTTQNYKTDHITMNCIDWMSKRSKIAKLQKESNYDQFASIWGQNNQKCRVTS